MYKYLFLAAALIITLAACSSSKNDCELATEAQIEAIEYCFKNQQKQVESAYAIKSNDFSRGYFVAAYVNGEDEPSMWIIFGDPSSPTLIHAVNDVADKISACPLSSTTKANATMADHGAKEAETCLISNSQ